MLVFLCLFVSRNAPGLTALPAVIALAAGYGLVYLAAVRRLFKPARQAGGSKVLAAVCVLLSPVLLVFLFLEATVLDYYQPLSLYDDAIAALALWWGLLAVACILSLLAARAALPALARICLVALAAWPLAASLWWINSPEPGEAVLKNIHVYVGGNGGYDTYRIPGLVLIPAGSRLGSGEVLVADRLLAFAEARRDGALDKGVIDLVLKSSDNGGESWGPQTVICRHEVAGRRGKCGNPTPLFDRDAGRIVLAFNKSGLDTDAWHHSSHVMFSEDGGQSWGDAREISNDNLVFGPGKGIQKRRAPHAGRLLIPGHSGGKAMLVFSDDHGASWQRGPGLAGGDETDVAERADGSLYLATRHRAPVSRAPEPNGRQFSISTDGGDRWPDLLIDQQLPTPVCQASVISAEGDSLLFSNPAHRRSRARMTLRHSPDGGYSWDEGLLVYPGPSGYSVLARGSGGSIYLLYENGNMAYSERISLARMGPQALQAGLTAEDSEK
jgi:sialidase-1